MPSGSNQSKALVPVEGLTYEQVKDLIERVKKGEALAVSALEWRERYVGFLEGMVETQDGYIMLGWARELCYHMAKQEEDKLWMLRAEQIYRLKHDRKVVVEQVEMEPGRFVELGQVRKPLWEWAFGGWCETWSDVCLDVLGLTPSSARVLERAWETYHVKLGYDTVRLASQGKSKSILALSVVSEDLDADGKLDEDLETLLDDGTWNEVRGYIAERREQSPARHPLSYEGERIIFWDMDDQPHKFGELALFDLPVEKALPKGRDRALWVRRQRAILDMVGEREVEEPE